ncbi:Polynucleotide adenylyltransferase region [Gloeothece citriformis PCC 7424]|uniref:Polynucleotide adenylyltransferase region n=1 Tax=Gloeothece citriformis (strain PCC 7424) TaxID=65393 RepID=B7K9H1_GLOC7|nr:CCA tRNA nucleotidyltransferase [Gloeothece citriformis]ACK68654.1 Polynucleotide adenylyltransferase region [Gloeothece citriformis PCC 7424]
MNNELFTYHLPFDLTLLPDNAYLVGGAVRDALLKRHRDYLDLDFVLPQLAIETARKIAKVYHAGFVILDQQRQIARVVFKESTVDFALQEGETLETDLHRRDYTVNAIAYNPHRGKLIDPLGGLNDLKQGILRMVSQKNLEDDPLRLLRAYRQAAQLNFTIDPITRSTLSKLAPLLSQVAAERVQTELGYLLTHSQGTYWIIEAWKDGLFKDWFKTLTPDKIDLLSRIDSSVQTLQKKLNEQFKVTEETLGIAKLTCLVSHVPEQAELELIDLKYSRAEIRAVTTTLKAIFQLQEHSDQMTLREQYFFFLQVGNIFPILAIFAIALGINQELILALSQRYLDPHDPVAHPQPLITGHDLKESLNLKPSPLIGKLLTELQIAQIEEKIVTVDEAIDFAKYLINSEQMNC